MDIGAAIVLGLACVGASGLVTPGEGVTVKSLHVHAARDPDVAVPKL
jgi:hypothetical protein